MQLVDRVDEPRGSEVAMGMETNSDHRSCLQEEGQERFQWERDFLFGQQAGALAYLIDLLPSKLYSDINDVAETAIKSELSSIAMSDLARGLCRRRQINTEDCRTVTRHWLRLFRCLKQQYLEEMRKNLDLFELWASRNVLRAGGDLSRLSLTNNVISGGKKKHTSDETLSIVGKQDHDDIDGAITELRKRLSKEKVLLEKNRQSMEALNRYLEQQRKQHMGREDGACACGGSDVSSPPSTSSIFPVDTGNICSEEHEKTPKNGRKRPRNNSNININIITPPSTCSSCE